MGFHYVGQAGLKLLTLGDPRASASQSAGITGVSHCTWPSLFYTSLYYLKFYSEHVYLTIRKKLFFLSVLEEKASIQFGVL